MKITDKQEIQQLWQFKKYGKTKQERERSEAILLSIDGKTRSQIAKILNVSIRSIFYWFNRYKKEGIDSFISRIGRGRKSILDDIHKDIVKKNIDNYPHQPKKAYSLTIEELKINMSYETFKRFLKKHSI